MFFGSLRPKYFPKKCLRKDAGNFAAGAIAARSWLMDSQTIEYGFGAYSSANNSKFGMVLEILYDKIIAGGNYLKPPTYGEFKITSDAIKIGISNERRFK